ncbi:hypothetical protein BVRB_9g207860 [Beta vulgaris subsp. vulgaris]|nr:hypothetical protein BVRB_9g207860 [Beta vulgaris subsp. vulgaris]
MVKSIVGAREDDYFGILTEILEVQYLDGKRVILFRCDWWDVHKVGRGIKIDNHGYVSVNSQRLLPTKEQFVLMSQAQQVFYVNDELDPNWFIVVKTQPRHHYNVSEKELIEPDEDAVQQNQVGTSHVTFVSPTDVEDIDDHIVGIRNDIGDMMVDATEENHPKEYDENEDVIFYDDDDDLEDDSENDTGSDEDTDDDIDLS